MTRPIMAKPIGIALVVTGLTFAVALTALSKGRPAGVGDQLPVLGLGLAASVAALVGVIVTSRSRAHLQYRAVPMPAATGSHRPIPLVWLAAEGEPAASTPSGPHTEPASPSGTRIKPRTNVSLRRRLTPRRGQRLEQSLEDIVFTVLDCETTGLHAVAGDRLVAVAAVRVVGSAVRSEDTFDELVNPRRTIPAAATAIHGITDATVSDARVAPEVVADFADYAGTSVLVGHHLGFDLGFLAPAAAKAGVDLESGTLDTMLLSAVLFTEPGARHGLDAVSRRLGVDVVGRHTALGDALATAEVLVRMIPLLAKRGIVTLGQARKASQGTDLARRIAEGA